MKHDMSVMVIYFLPKKDTPSDASPFQITTLEGIYQLGNKHL
jgi:hypothetical protein